MYGRKLNIYVCLEYYYSIHFNVLIIINNLLLVRETFTHLIRVSKKWRKKFQQTTCFHWNPFLVTRVGVSHPIQVFRFIVVVQSIPGHYSSIQYTVHSTQYSSSTIHPRTLQLYIVHSTYYSSSTIHPRTLQLYLVHSTQYTLQQQYNLSQDLTVLYSTQYTVHSTQYSSSTIHPRTLQSYIVHSTQYSLVVVQYIPGHYSSIQYTVQSIVQQQYNTSQDIKVLYSTQYTVQYSSSTIHPRTLQSYIAHGTLYSTEVVQSILGHYNPTLYTVLFSSSIIINQSQDIIVL